MSVCIAQLEECNINVAFLIEREDLKPSNWMTLVAA